MPRANADEFLFLGSIKRTFDLGGRLGSDSRLVRFLAKYAPTWVWNRAFKGDLRTGVTKEPKFRGHNTHGIETREWLA